MSSLLDYLENETLPKPVERAFVEWCVWEQARRALTVILKSMELHSLIEALGAAQNLDGLFSWSENATRIVNRMQPQAGALNVSSAKAALFEFQNLTKAARKGEWDPGGAAFFSARVCGWAGWAATGFSQPAQKNLAEQEARQEQENRLTQLLQQSNNPDS
jgi:hypothetical protein